MDFDVPIQAKPVTKDGKQFLKIYTEQEDYLVEAPIKPYLFVTDKSILEGQVYTQFLGKLLSTRKHSVIYRVEFNTLQEMDEFKSGNPDKWTQPLLNFIDMVVMNCPDFFKQYPSRDTTILTYDIEQYTEPWDGFPPASNPVISVSHAFNDEDVQHNNVVDKDEAFVVKNFASEIYNRDPKIIVGFNHIQYDNKVMDYKFDEFGVPAEIWSKDLSREPFYYDKQIGPMDLQGCSVDGRIMFDVFHYTLTDQSLNGQKRGLKAVSEHFKDDLGIDLIVEEDIARKGTAWLLEEPEKLKAYNNSDVTLTWKLFNHYIANSVSVANFVGAPLHRVVPLSTTYAFKILLAGILESNNIIADSNNITRYENYYADLEGTEYFDLRTNERKNRGPFQGAISDCFKPGRYEAAIEDDVGSLYPTLMAALGIGPDNTQIVDTIPFVDVEFVDRVNNKGEKSIVYKGGRPAQEFKVEVNGDTKTYYMPDDVRKWTWVIEVVGRSPVADKIEEYLVERLEVKHRAKVEHSLALFGIAYALKVVLNSAYGLGGEKFSPFGELGVAVMTALSGRMVLTEGMKFMGEDIVLFVDTDSMKYEPHLAKPLAELNAHFEVWMPEVLKAKPMIKWEREELGNAFFKQPKTYLFFNEDGALVKKGGAFKGTKYTSIFNKIIDRVAPVFLKEGEDAARQVAREMIDLEGYDVEDYIMTVRIGQPLHKYANPNSLVPSVARMVSDKTGAKLKSGMTLDYIKTFDGYDIPSESALKNLDKKYYLGIVMDALERMNLCEVISDNEFIYMTRNPNQDSLEKWGLF